jgi:hypothetical protein
MPDHENTFVLKTDNGREEEFVVEVPISSTSYE